MDVINFSGGGAMSEPAADPILEAVGNVARAGVVPVISAGNDRDEFGFGTVGSPGVADEAISVAAVSNSHVFAPPLRVLAADAPVSLQTIPMAAAFERARHRPAADARRRRRRSWAGTADRSTRSSAASASTRTTRTRPSSRRGRSPAWSRSRRAARAPSSRRPSGRRPPARSGCPRRQPLRRGKRDPAGAAGSGGDDRRPRRTADCARTWRRRAAGRPSAGREADRDRDRAERHRHELLVRGADELRALAQAGRRRAGRPDPLVDLAGVGGRRHPVRGLRRDEHVGAARRRCRRAPAPGPPDVDAAPDAVGVRPTAVPAWGNTARTQEAPVLLQGGGLVDVMRADEPLLFTSPVSLSFGDVNVNRGPQTRAPRDAARRRGRWGGHMVGGAGSAGGVSRRKRRARPAGDDRAGRKRPPGCHGSRAGRRGRGRQLRLHRAATRRRHPQDPVLLRRHAPRARAAAPRRTAPGVQHRRHARRRLPRERLPLPVVAVRPACRLPVRPLDAAGRSRGPLLRADRRARRQLRRRRVVWPADRRPDRPVDPRVARRERRPGTGRDADQRQQLHLRLLVRRGRGRRSRSRGRSATGCRSTPGRDRFTDVPLHGPYVLKAWQNDVYPPLVAHRLRTRHRGTAARDRAGARLPRQRSRFRDRPVVARPCVPPRPRRRLGVRPAHGLRDLRAPCGGARDPRRADERDDPRRRLPGGEERLDPGRQRFSRTPRSRASSCAAWPARR